MRLSSGVRVGPYEITACVGAGGMGEVYRATDTNLKRAVAIKILPETFAGDADRLARFQREAEVLAALNHPHIAAIYGLERSQSQPALVMELVEGPTLADRIGLGPIPVDEATAIAKQVAEALEAAHALGIIHRDLKPANIKLRPDGTVKILDFGLAKMLEPAAATGSAAASPTITSPAMLTAGGVLLGTAAYMSPEQVRGKPLDKRCDMWAFGAVLFEMLTARRAFPGDDIADVLAAVLTREPDWTLLPPTVQPAMSTLIQRCLQKDRAQRLRDAGDAWLALDGAFSVTPATTAAAAPRKRVLTRALAFAATGVVVAGAASFAAWNMSSKPPTRLTTRFEYVLPAGQQLPSTQRPAIAVFNDGSSFVYQTTAGMYRRAIGDLEARLIQGTSELSYAPMVSPDGRWLAYFSASGHLKKLPIAGGAPVTLCAATTPFGASWQPDNTILFAQPTGILRVSGDAGTPSVIVPAKAGEQIYGAQLLPRGRAMLFSVTTQTGPSRWDDAQIVVEDLSSHRRTIVVEGGTDPRYLRSGHVVYRHGDTLYGIRFDEDRLEPRGGPVPLIQGVRPPVGVLAAGSNYSVSDEGTLVYVAQSASTRSLVWINRNGTAAGPIKTIPSGAYEEPRLSPDGRRVLVTGSGDVWIYDIGSGRKDRITSDGVSQMGVWSPDGAQVAYSSARTGNMEAWVKSSDGTGESRQLTKLGGQVHVDTWSPDGETVAVHRHDPQGEAVDMYMVPMNRADAKPEPFLAGDAHKESAALSGDHQYVSYLSNETGQWEVFIRPYQKSGQREMVSIGGGREPVWSRNGDLFYRSLNGDKMFSVAVKTTPTVSLGTPVQVFEGLYFVSPTGSPRAQYDVTADGQRFLMISSNSAPGSAPEQPRVIVVQQWSEEVRAKFEGK